MRFMDFGERDVHGSFCVFEVTRGFTRRSQLRVELPAAWARDHAGAVVVFLPFGGDLGAHACVIGDEGAVLLTFPWYDHMDRVLLAATDWERPPIEATEEEWEDLEQGWFAWVKADGDRVYIADGDFDEILTVRDARRLERRRPGVVAVDDVEVRWNCVPRVSYDSAWESAIESCRAGRPSPVGEWADRSRDQVRLLD